MHSAMIQSAIQLEWKTDMRNRRLCTIFMVVLICPATASDASWFAGYDFGQMAFNDFKNFSGELGVRFNNKHAMRLSYLNIALTERHLSSNESSAVEGNYVEGLWHEVDIYYDYPVWNNFFMSPFVGYHDTTYTHLLVAESVTNTTALAGLAFLYMGDDVLGIDDLYWRAAATFYHRFEPLEKTRLGDSVVNAGTAGP